MLIVLSPAKSLDFDSPLPVLAEVQASRPEFESEAGKLVSRLRKFSPAELAALMDLSDSLASLNVARYASFALRGTPALERPAVLAFDGDVYAGLSARELDAPALTFAQEHVRILSGLYGVLRPLDLIQPYRLEMGTRLETGAGTGLYPYWATRPARTLRQALESRAHRVLVNLASEEYFKAVDLKALGFPVVQPVFQELRAGRYKVVSFAAKRARGAMTRFAIDERIEDPQALKGFDRDGYRYDPQASTESVWVFRREAP